MDKSDYITALTNKAANTLAHMLDFAVHDLKQDASAFFDLFIASGIAGRFECRDIRFIAGTSGVELAYRVLEACGISPEHVSYRYTPGRSREFWAGWALAKYQQESGSSYRDITTAVPVKEIIAMCDRYRNSEIKAITETLSWMEALKVPDHMNADNYADFRSHIYEAVSASGASKETSLKSLRLKSGYSQSGLAAASGVPVRTIQQYEQRQKNINKAAFESIIKLAAALSCEPDDLMDN